MRALAGAACAEPSYNANWWTGHRTDGHAKAAIICADCPVRRVCAERAEQERTTATPPLFHQTPVRPFGVLAGRMYDGTTREPLPVRIAEQCSQCRRTFVPERTNVQRCATCRTAHGRAPKPSEPAHGTRTGYVHHGCRCQQCTASNRDYGRVAQRRRRARGAA